MKLPETKPYEGNEQRDIDYAMGWNDCREELVGLNIEAIDATLRQLLLEMLNIHDSHDLGYPVAEHVRMLLKPGANGCQP